MCWVAQPARCMAQPAIWCINPLQTLSQGLVLTLRFTFDPELDNYCALYKSGFVEDKIFMTMFSYAGSLWTPRNINQDKLRLRFDMHLTFT